jgi:hypothetical protein
LEDWFRTGKEHLAHANVLATKYQDAKKAFVEAKKLAEEADIKRKEAEESLDAALASLTKAEDKIRALELEFERAKKAAYESGSKEAQEEMGRQLPGVCNEYYTDAWNDALAVLSSGQTMLLPNPIKLPFPGATPPLLLKRFSTLLLLSWALSRWTWRRWNQPKRRDRWMQAFMTLLMEEAPLRTWLARMIRNAFS